MTCDRERGGDEHRDLDALIDQAGEAPECNRCVERFNDDADDVHALHSHIARRRPSGMAGTAVGSPRTPAWPRDELATAIRTRVLHGGGARHAERAFVTANARRVIDGEWSVTLLTLGTHLEGHGRSPS